MKLFRKMIFVAASAIPVAAFAQQDVLQQAPTQATMNAYLQMIGAIDGPLNPNNQRAEQQQQQQLELLRQQLELQRQQMQQQAQQQAQQIPQMSHMQQTTTTCHNNGYGLVCDSRTW